MTWVSQNRGCPEVAKNTNRTPFFWCALFFGTKPCCRMALIRALVGCDDGTSYLLRRLQTGGHHGHQPQRCQPHHGLLEELNHVPNNAYTIWNLNLKIYFVKRSLALHRSWKKEERLPFNLLSSCVVMINKTCV